MIFKWPIGPSLGRHLVVAVEEHFALSPLYKVQADSGRMAQSEGTNFSWLRVAAAYPAAGKAPGARLEPKE